MALRFYIAPQIGTGVWPDAYRSLLHELIDTSAGDSFTEIDNPARRISICCVRASDATHTTIMADSRVFPVSAKVTTAQELKTHLDSLLGSIPNVETVKTNLENNGVSCSWLSSSNTVRNALRYVIRIFAIAQISDGEQVNEVKDFIREHLDVEVKDVSQAIRIKVKDWMQAKGLAIGWIMNSTTVREILHFIVMNLGIGKLKMSGEEF
jgi:hypothetical protein